MKLKLHNKIIRYLNIYLTSAIILLSPSLGQPTYCKDYLSSSENILYINKSSYNLSNQYNNYYKTIYNMKNVYFSKKYFKYIKTKKDIEKIIHNKKIILNIMKASNKTKIPAKLIAAVIKVESNGDKKAQSWCGNMGLMQISSYLSKKYNVDPWNTYGNIKAGTKYLKYLSTKFNNKKQILEAYNAGPGFVYRYGDTGEPLLYAEKVLYYYYYMKG